MKYDLSKVPRPLHSPTLKCYFRVAKVGWDIVVGDRDFDVVVAYGLSKEEARVLVQEIERVLQAHRLLVGKPTLLDLAFPSLP